MLFDCTDIVENNKLLKRKTEQWEETLKVLENIFKVYEESEDEDEEEEDENAMEYKEASPKMKKIGMRKNT